MPSPTSPYEISTYTKAQDIPENVWGFLQANSRNSNIILPHAENSRQMERDDEVVATSPAQYWIVCETALKGLASIDFVLSCTEGKFGPYPIFIITSLPPNDLSVEYNAPRITSLARALRREVSLERVFSVFALEPISRLFASIWTQETDVPLDPTPEYYAAKISYCTMVSQAREMTLSSDAVHDLRPGTAADVPRVAKLCYGFASEAEPFVLTQQQAHQEAATLTAKGQLWVYEVHTPGEPSEISSMVAVTRTSEAVAAITKVYTDHKWRKRGCAERLTRRVCEHLLETKDSVVLYVAHNNPAAAKVYHRVGFVGLGENDGPVEGVDSWLELGFDRRVVKLGHW